jgi:DNA-binding winged helix-turn-helix (wHTH) protein
VLKFSTTWSSTATASCQKEELLDNLWPDVHVSESALTTAIRDARARS